MRAVLVLAILGCCIALTSAYAVPLTIVERRLEPPASLSWGMVPIIDDMAVETLIGNDRVSAAQPLTTINRVTALDPRNPPQQDRTRKPLNVDDRVTPFQTLNVPARVTPAELLTPVQRPTLLDTVAPTIAIFEDRRRWAYDDPAGNRSVGIGSNLDADGAADKLKTIGANYRRVRAGLDPLSEGQITTLFRMDLQTAIDAVHRLVPSLEQHPQPVQAVVVDLCFNLGATGFSKLKTFRRYLADKDYSGAARALRRTHWYKQVGYRAKDDVEALLLVK